MYMLDFNEVLRNADLWHVSCFIAIGKMNKNKVIMKRY